jgi:hypothetical protein
MLIVVLRTPEPVEPVPSWSNVTGLVTPTAPPAGSLPVAADAHV